jgi:Calcineurin-like phosphoesterase
MGRTVIVGDVHGCTGELEELLEKVRFAENDALVFVGDLVARGPDSTGTLALARRLRARVTRGNHEEKLLAWRSVGKPLGPEHERLAKTLSQEDWQMLEAMPLWLDLQDHGVRVVHAGVIPGLGIEVTPPEAVLKMRTLDDRGRWSDASDEGPLWGERYHGLPHVVFGHNARANPQLHPWATGIDTACVYGGRLTALVLEEGEPMARGDSARRLLKSVPALRTYSRGSGTPLARN